MFIKTLLYIDFIVGLIGFLVLMVTIIYLVIDTLIEEFFNK